MPIARVRAFPAISVTAESFLPYSPSHFPRVVKMSDPVPPPSDQLRVAPGDITVTPGYQGFLIGRVAADGTWVALDPAPSLAVALRKVQAYSRVRDSRVLVSRDGTTFELFDPSRLWLGRDRYWCVYLRWAVDKYAPALPGLYMVRFVTPIYVGDTDNLRERLLFHLEGLSTCPEARQGPLEFCFEVEESADVRSRRASDLIEWWSPPCNQHA
jgi:hypothetical protein